MVQWARMAYEACPAVMLRKATQKRRLQVTSRFWKVSASTVTIVAMSGRQYSSGKLAFRSRISLGKQ